MNSLLAFWTANKSQIMEALGMLYALLNIVNGMLKDSKEKSALGSVLHWISFLTRSDAPGTLKMPFKASGSATMVLFAASYLSACATLKADYKLYEPTFVGCLEAKGLSEAPGLGANVFDILTAGKGDVTGQLDSVLASLGTEAAKDVFGCAIQAWASAHPVSGKPTKSQAAARVMQARLVKRAK